MSRLEHLREAMDQMTKALHLLDECEAQLPALKLATAIDAALVEAELEAQLPAA